MTLALATNGRARSDLRARIVDAAWTLGHEGSDDALTIRNIALRAGVSPALLYTYFDGKAALLCEMQRLALPRLQAALAEAVTGAATPDEGLSRACLAYVDFARGHRWMYDPNARDPSLHAAANGLTNAFVARLVELLEARGCEGGNAEQTAARLRIAIAGLISAEPLGDASHSRELDSREFVEGYIRLLMRGV
jgi:AcrR family transcriptional regulator